jgi:hypothetical protein
MKKVKRYRTPKQFVEDQYYVARMKRKSADWDEFSNGKYAIEKTITRMNSNEKKLIAAVTEIQTDLPPPQLSKIYMYKIKKWEHIGYRCMECDKSFSNQLVIEKHMTVCERINRRQDEENDYLQYVTTRIDDANTSSYEKW